MIERHRGVKGIGLGVVRGFGLKEGAIATTISHDSHNLIAVGTNDQDILKAVERLGEIGEASPLQKEEGASIRRSADCRPLVGQTA